MRRKRLRIGVALTAACVLVLQSVLGAFALGAGPAPHDAFGNIICTADGAEQGPGSSGGHLPNCCMLGCGACVQGAGYPPAEASGIAAPFSETAARFHLPVIPFFLADERRLGNPRAPPRAA